MAGFLSPLELEFIDGHNWKVTEPFEYCLGDEASSRRVRIPAGFITDFASVPRGLWNILPPAGPYGKAAVIHDWLYQKRRISYVDEHGRVFGVSYADRALADATLEEGMEVLGVGRLTRWAVYHGVRVGGWVAWNNYRQKETA